MVLVLLGWYLNEQSALLMIPKALTNWLALEGARGEGRHTLQVVTVQAKMGFQAQAPGNLSPPQGQSLLLKRFPLNVLRQGLRLALFYDRNPGKAHLLFPSGPIWTRLQLYQVQALGWMNFRAQQGLRETD